MRQCVTASWRVISFLYWTYARIFRQVSLLVLYILSNRDALWSLSYVTLGFTEVWRPGFSPVLYRNTLSKVQCLQHRIGMEAIFKEQPFLGQPRVSLNFQWFSCPQNERSCEDKKEPLFGANDINGWPHVVGSDGELFSLSIHHDVELRIRVSLRAQEYFKFPWCICYLLVFFSVCRTASWCATSMTDW